MGWIGANPRNEAIIFVLARHKSRKMNFPTESDYSQVVSAENLERELDQVRIASAGALSGGFGPQSLTWVVCIVDMPV